ncbi:hypothetical protein BDN70DRAFT_384156 [Pholiota conissans]|uniref:Uncharacterized protein n=1 Tax=Pholiota conissans TaxID=109636 RepID=A0A9P6CUQ4_9AGAR|nr:hypothetical protein BDN70DRAFT_384156 [Pholiota conissans]
MIHIFRSAEDEFLLCYDGAYLCRMVFACMFAYSDFLEMGIFINRQDRPSRKGGIIE